MADEPISALTQIGAPGSGYSTSFTNPTTGAVLEILDTTNTTMASTGTNSKIAPGDLIKGYLAAGTNVTLTETSGIVTIASSGGFSNPMTTAGDEIIGGSGGTPQRLAVGSNGQVHTVVSGAPAWANPVTSNYVSNTVSSAGEPYNIVSGTYANIPGADTTITLSAGTWLLGGTVRTQSYVTGTAINQFTNQAAQLYDSTNTVAVSGSQCLVGSVWCQITGSAVGNLITTNLPVAFYTVSASATIHLQLLFSTNGSSGSTFINSDVNGVCGLWGLRVS